MTKSFANKYPGPGRGYSLRNAVKIMLAGFILAAVLMCKLPPAFRCYCYGAVREIMRIYTVIGTWRMEKIVSEHFYVKFKPGDRAGAELALETAERFYRPVAEDFDFSFRARIPVIIYSSREELNKSFGWEAKENAIGVYWAGTIRVLSPEAWIGEKDPDRAEEIFIKSGPMVHEFAHLIVDYLAGGNYPRWFTEGVAQYEEYKLTGFEFENAAGSLKQTLYSMQELTRDFDSLPNQSLAYRESFAAVRYIVCFYGEEALTGLIKELRDGKDFNQGIQNVLGLDDAGFETLWQEWAILNFS